MHTRLTNLMEITILYFYWQTRYYYFTIATTINLADI